MSEFKNFPLSLRECKLILDSIDGLIAVNKDGKVLYMAEDMKQRIEAITREKLPESVYGMDIKKIHPASKLIDALELGKNARDRNLAVYLTMGIINVARIKKIFDDNKLEGFIDFDLFGNAIELNELFEKLRGFTEAGMLDFANSLDLITANDKRFKDVKYTIADILGESKSIVDLKKSIYSISDFESTVLIEGETGCGKELVVHSIHNLSRRIKNPLVEINCSAIPESLFESEFFGYEDGTFTGARKGGKAGKLEIAEKGTLFLDEIDQLPYHMQPKLLRVLQEREFSRIGGKTRSMDVRIVAASNKNLSSLVKEGKFREDLYYRLNIIRLVIPPLRDRKEDLSLLINHFIKQMNVKLNKRIEGVAPEVMRIFYEYSWPGNVRELKNLIERAMYLCRGKRIELDNLGDFMADMFKPELEENVLEADSPLEKAKELVEKKIIMEAMEICGGNKRKTAELLKISRATLYNKLDKLKNMSS